MKNTITTASSPASATWHPAAPVDTPGTYMDQTKNSGFCSPLQKFEREKTVADQLGISPRHLRDLRAQRLIPFVRLGRSIRFDPVAVAQAVKRLTVEVRT
jgi:excisionase family DNA binding protein